MTPQPLNSGSISGSNAPEEKPNRLPLAIAGALVVVVGLLVLILSIRHKPASQVTAIDAPADPYATKLIISGLAMSESSNLAGGKVTYLDGHIANQGDRTVSGITVQVIFRNYAKEVAQKETLPLTLVRMREPYIDTEPVAAAPLKPSGEHDFRLIFDNVSPDWAGAMPDLRVLSIEMK